MKTISLKLPKLLLDRVEAEARGRGSTKSALIRDCVEQVLLRPKGGRRASCLELMGDLIGSQSGPRDLSSNKAYLKGLGRERSRPH